MAYGVASATPASDARARSWETATFAAAVVWLTLSFGGVYSWGFTPAFVCVGGAAAARLWRCRNRVDECWRALAVTVAIVGVVLVIQLVPVPAAVADAVSPELQALRSQLDLPYALPGGGHGWQSLSLQPVLTARAALCLLTLALLLLAFAAEFHGDEFRTIARVIVIVGVAITISGAIQRVSGTPYVYGFWEPENGPRAFAAVGGPFGPFINRNHFAGWMLLAIPLAVAYVVRQAKVLPATLPLYKRVLWLRTPAGTELLLTAFGLGVMTVGLMLTASRSGIASLVAVSCLVAFAAFVRSRHRLRSLMAIAAGAAVLCLAFMQAGSELIFGRFGRAAGDLAGRQRAWADALDIFRDFRWVGTGLNTYGQANLLYEAGDSPVHHAQAHNDYLQLLAETGSLGAIALLVSVGVWAWVAARRLQHSSPTGRFTRWCAVTALCAIGVQELFDFSLQMPANAVLATLALGMVIRPTAHQSRPSVSYRKTGTLIH